MCTEPTPTCRIFVSRNSCDRKASKAIRTKLEGVAGNLEFFDDGDIDPGEGWRDRLRSELQKANLLLLLLTNPSDDFDWPLYEAGLFESLEEVDHRRVVCIYPDPDVSGVGPPSQIADKEGVPATKEFVLKFLGRLFRDKEFTNTITPLHSRVPEEKLQELATEIADLINKVEPSGCKRTYANYYIQVLLPPDAASLGPETEIESDERSLRHLFGFGESPPRGKRWTWNDVVEPLDGPNLLWTAELAEAVTRLKAGHFFSPLSCLFLAADKSLYRPGIEIYRRYDEGRMTVDVSFSEEMQDARLKTARPPVALAAHFELASRIHYELIEPYLCKISGWRRKKKKKENGCAELSKAIQEIEHYEYFVGQLTSSQIDETFSSTSAASGDVDALGDELAAITEELETEIKPKLQRALASQSIPQLRDALQHWRKNSLRLLEVYLNRCQMILAA